MELFWLAALAWICGLGLRRTEIWQSLGQKQPAGYQFGQDRLDLTRLWPKGSEAHGGQLISFIGMVFIMISAAPLVLHFQASHALYTVMLSYTFGLFLLARWIRKSLPWTGQIFILISLFILPLNWLGISSLNFGQRWDIVLACLAVGTLSWFAYALFKAMHWRRAPLYLPILIFLGGFSAFSRELTVWVGHWGGDRQAFEYLILILPACFLAMGLWQQNLELKSEAKLGIYWGSQFLLLIMYLITPVVNGLTWATTGFGLALLGSIWVILSIINCMQTQSDRGRALELQAFVYFSLGSFMARGEPLSLLLISLLGIPCFWILSWFHWQNWRQWAYQGLAALYLLIGGYYLMAFSALGRDQQSLCFALLALSLVGGATLFEKRLQGGIPRWWKTGCYYIALLISCGTWVLLSYFQSWSYYTVGALVCTALTYALFALYHQRNVLSYIAVLTLTVALFSGVTLHWPLLAFEAYRWLALSLSLCFLYGGYLIQRRVIPQAVSVQTQSFALRHLNWQTLWKQDLIQPFQFQQRYQSPIPYLLCEPLYNMALMLTTVSLFFEPGDALFSLSTVPVYLLIFKIYPSRLWLYFVIVTSTDGLLGLITEALPDRYHHWTLVFLSLGWFFVGILVEELLAARDRKQPLSSQEKNQRLAQPFFQSAIILNIWVLRYFFGDLQTVFSPEGWANMRQESLALILTASLYLLKLRVYLSKLWLYPGLVTATIGLYFGLSYLLGIEASICLLTLIALGWLAVGYTFEKSKAIQTYLRESMAYRWPHLKPETRAYRTHLADFASPFYTMSGLMSLIALGFSLVLYPPLDSWFIHSFEFGLQQANAAQLYGYQTLTWLTLTCIWAGIYLQRGRKTVYFHLIQGHLIGALLWSWQGWIEANQWPLIFASLALGWQSMSLLLSKQPKREPCSVWVNQMALTLSSLTLVTWVFLMPGLLSGLLLTLWAWLRLHQFGQRFDFHLTLTLGSFTWVFALLNFSTPWLWLSASLWGSVAIYSYLWQAALDEGHHLTPDIKLWQQGSFYMALGGWFFLKPGDYYSGTIFSGWDLYYGGLGVLGFGMGWRLSYVYRTSHYLWAVCSLTLVLFGMYSHPLIMAGLSWPLFTLALLAFLRLKRTSNNDIAYPLQVLSLGLCSLIYLLSLQIQFSEAWHPGQHPLGFNNWAFGVILAFVLLQEKRPKFQKTAYLISHFILGILGVQVLQWILPLFLFEDSIPHLSYLKVLFYLLPPLSLLYLSAYRQQNQTLANSALLATGIITVGLGWHQSLFACLIICVSALGLLWAPRLKVLVWSTELYASPLAQVAGFIPIVFYLRYTPAWLAGKPAAFTVLLLATGFYLFFFARRRGHQGLFWGSLALLNISWYLGWTVISDLDLTAFYHVLLWFPAGLILWGSAIRQQVKALRDLGYYLGLGLVLLVPLLCFGQREIGTLMHTVFGLEWLLLVALMLRLSMALRIQALMITGVTAAALTLGSIAIYLLTGSVWWMHWILLLGTGLVFVTGGMALHTLFANWRHTWARVLADFQTWH